jgi:hypothetical protein
MVTGYFGTWWPVEPQLFNRDPSSAPGENFWPAPVRVTTLTQLPMLGLLNPTYLPSHTGIYETHVVCRNTSRKRDIEAVAPP